MFEHVTLKAMGLFALCLTVGLQTSCIDAEHTDEDNPKSSKEPAATKTIAQPLCGGAPTYVSQWGTPGRGPSQFTRANDVFVDENGPSPIVYVLDSFNNRVQKFDTAGNFLSQWPVMAAEASGIAVDRHGKVFISGTLSNVVLRYDIDGNHELTWGSAGSANGQFQVPEGIAIDDSGPTTFVYTSERNGHRVQKFDSDGNHIATWGGVPGNADGQFRGVWDVAVDNQGRVYVADRDNHRIQRLDSDGNHELTWGSDGAAEGQFRYPSGLVVDDNHVYVADTVNHRLQIFDLDGNHQFTVSSPPFGTGDGEFHNPRGIDIDSQGIIYVADSFNARIQTLSCPMPDVAPPVVNWSGANAPDTSGTPVQVSPTNGFSVDDLTVLDTGIGGTGGLVSLALVLDGSQTILSETYNPSTRLPQSNFTCTPGACEPPGNVMFLYGGLPGNPLPDGNHCAVLTAIDEEGNAAVQNICWTLGVPDLESVRANAISLCEQVDTEMSVYEGHADLDVAADALSARQVCSEKGLGCINSEPDGQLGCYLLSLVAVHKLVNNVEALLGQPDAHIALRGGVVNTAKTGLLYIEDTSENNKPTSFQNGSDILEGITGSGASAMSDVETAFFWFEDARYPRPALTVQEASCAGLSDLVNELDVYADDISLPAFEDVGGVRDQLGTTIALLCNTDLAPEAPCYDRSFLLGLSALMDTATALKDLRENATTGEDGGLVWTRNWQLGISRVAQYWLNLSLDNLDLWVQAGGVEAGYETIKQEAEDSWGNADAQLNGGDLDGFIFNFTDPQSKCLMYDAFEYVNHWWNDASNAACGAGIDYPDACFNEQGENKWPLHQVEVTGDDGEACEPGCGDGEVCVEGTCVVEAASGLRFTLQWEGTNDLDLHLDTPTPSEVYYSATSADGCMLDTDAGSGPGAVENINCQADDLDFVAGTFTFRVTNFSGADNPEYTLSVFRDGTLVATHTDTIPANGPEDPHDGSIQGPVRTISFP